MKKLYIIKQGMKEQGQKPINQLISMITEVDEMQENKDILMKIEEDLSEWHLKLQKSLLLQCEPKRQTYIYDEDKPRIQKKNTSASKFIRMFDQYHHEIMCFLRAKFVIEQLVQPIQKLQYLDFNQQPNIEFMYLCSQRALSFLKIAEKPFKNIPNQQIQEGTQYFIDSVFSLLQKATLIFNNYYRILTIKENSMKSRIFSFHSYFFDYKNKQKKDIILCGFEGVDFTAEQQIKYTQQFYIRNVVGELERQGCGQKRLGKLKNYLIIMTIDCENMTSFDDFQNLKQQIISKSLDEKSEESSI